MGEHKLPMTMTTLATAAGGAMAVDTLGGRMHVRWDEQAQATPHGQLVFFAEFLATAGVFDRWVQECSHRLMNGCDKRHQSRTSSCEELRTREWAFDCRRFDTASSIIEIGALHSVEAAKSPARQTGAIAGVGLAFALVPAGFVLLGTGALRVHRA